MESIKTIVALVSLSATSFKVLKQAHAFARACQADVVLLHVVPPEASVIGVGIASPTVLQDPTPRRVAAESQDLEEMRKLLADFGITVRAQQANIKTADQLLAKCRDLGADLIIVGAHAHGAVYNWLIGSVTAEVVQKSQIPTLVVPGVDVTAPVVAA